MKKALIALSTLLSAPLAHAGITLGLDGGLGIYGNGIGADPTFGAEVLDDIYSPLRAGFFFSYTPLGGASQGGVSVGANLVSFGLEGEYPLSMLLGGLSVGLQLGAGYETVPVNAGGTLAAGSNWVFGFMPDVAYDYRFTPAWSAGAEAAFLYFTAPSFSGVSGPALTAPVFLLRLRYALGAGAEPAAVSAPTHPQP